MSLKQDIIDARQNHDIHAILDTDKDKLVCPLPSHIHHDYSASFTIFFRGGVQWFKCHGNCGAEGDVIDLVGYLRIPSYDRASFSDKAKALAMLDSRYEIHPVTAPKRNESRLDPQVWKAFLPPGPEVLKYAGVRGLSQSTVERFKMGQSGHWMTIPCFEEGVLVGVKLRNLTPQGLRYMSLAGSRQGLFNYDAVRYTDQPVLIVKGEIPAMLLTQMGYLACAPTGGEGGWREEWRTALAFAKKILIGDNDATGRKMGVRRKVLLGARLLVFPPEQYKDIDEFILADPVAGRKLLDGWVACVQ